MDSLQSVGHHRTIQWSPYMVGAWLPFGLVSSVGVILGITLASLLG